MAEPHNLTDHHTADHTTHASSLAGHAGSHVGNNELKHETGHEMHEEMQRKMSRETHHAGHSSHSGHCGNGHRRGIAALFDRHDSTMDFEEGDGDALAPTAPTDQQATPGSVDGCCCHSDGARVVFIGNPNVGKSSLFNAMLGMHAKVMNAPGTTVLLEHGTYRYVPRRGDTAAPAQEWDFTDTPGTYSLLPMSPDEEVAVEAVTGAKGHPQPDLIVAAIDATNLSRSLYFLAQVLELGRPTVVALTMTDLASRQGTPVDAVRLQRALDGVPVVAVDGRVGEGCDELADAIAGALEAGTPMPRGLAERPIAGLTMRQWVRSRSDERFEWAARVLSDVGMGGESGLTLSDRIDKVLLHPVWGIVVFLIVMFAVFQATTTLAGPAQDWFDVTVRGWCETGIDWIFGLFGPGASDGWFHSLIVNGLLDGIITVATFIPPMGIMFILLSLLEDCGYLARAAFVMDRAMRALGLDGRAFLPIVVGFGCNLPGLAATRTLPDSRQRVLVGMLIPFASCSARLSVYLGFS